MAGLSRKFFVGVLLCVATSLFAQYGQIIEQVAGQDPLSVGASIRLLGVAAGSIPPEMGMADARASLLRLGVRVPSGSNDSPISYGEFAFLLVQLYDQPRSLSSRIMPGPRTAFYDLKEKGLIPAAARPGFTISGPDALLLQRRFLEARKAEK